MVAAIWQDPPAPAAGAPFAERMLHRMATAAGRLRYILRQQTVEPTLGTIKEVMGFRRFSMRGESKAAMEWTLVSLAFNPKRLHRLGSDLNPACQPVGGCCLAPFGSFKSRSIGASGCSSNEWPCASPPLGSFLTGRSLSPVRDVVRDFSFWLALSLGCCDIVEGHIVRSSGSVAGAAPIEEKEVLGHG
jgi:hypothetical protein